jgi:hypothetical protein
MSALVPVIHSPLTVFTVWEIGHDPDTKGDHDHARTGSAQVTFIDDYNRRFGKFPRDRHDAHRAVRKDEDLDAI